MASPALRELAQETVQAGALGDARLRLGTAVLTDAIPGPISWRCSTFLVKCRTQGFMALFPNLDVVVATLNSFEAPSADEAAVMSQVVIQLETSRGRLLGEVEAILADIPWAYLPLFRKHGSRVALHTHLFHVGTTMGRPVLASVEEVAAHWIHQVLDAPTADEYHSAFEVDGMLMNGPADVDADPVPSTPAGSQQVPPEVQRLQERGRQLESMMAKPDVAAAVASPPVPEATGLLFGQDRQSSRLSSTELQRLQRAAGPAPKRLGRAERVPALPPDPHEAVEHMVAAEVDREVGEEEVEEDPMLANMQAAMQQVTDPFQKMLMFQLHQTSQLVQSLAPKQTADPLSAVLGGTDSGSGSSSSGMSVKGYAARELFLKQLGDDRKICALIKQHALQELGLPPERADGSLLRTFLEHRVPLSDRKSLIQFGYILVAGWEAGHKTGNIQLQAFSGRMMMYVEQCALDEGKSNLAWLLTGLPEPNFQQLSLNRKRTTLTPFSKLAPPSWVAANVGYLRDVELFETRLKQLTPGKGPSAPARDSDNEEKPNRPKAKPKQKKPKGGKGAEASTSETPNP